jgi:hypothetical protein
LDETRAKIAPVVQFGVYLHDGLCEHKCYADAECRPKSEREYDAFCTEQSSWSNERFPEDFLEACAFFRGICGRLRISLFIYTRLLRENDLWPDLGKDKEYDW